MQNEPNEQQRVAIPKEAQETILKLYDELTRLNGALTDSAPYVAVQDARLKFVEFLMATKTALGLPVNEFWDISEEADAFVKLGQIPGYAVVDAEPSSESQPPVPVLDARDACSDPGDCSGA